MEFLERAARCSIQEVHRLTKGVLHLPRLNLFAYAISIYLGYIAIVDVEEVLLHGGGGARELLVGVGREEVVVVLDEVWPLDQFSELGHRVPVFHSIKCKEIGTGYEKESETQREVLRSK